jgi:hypothetical protein
LNVVEPLGLELHLVHPWKTRAIASARIKHDRLDARVLAELLRTGFLAEAWIAPCASSGNCSAIACTRSSGRRAPRTRFTAC